MTLCSMFLKGTASIFLVYSYVRHWELNDRSQECFLHVYNELVLRCSIFTVEIIITFVNVKNVNTFY